MAKMKSLRLSFTAQRDLREVPVLSMCPTTGKELGRFHRFVRPGHWTREESSMKKRFNLNCFNQQANAIPFPEAELMSPFSPLLV